MTFTGSSLSSWEEQKINEAASCDSGRHCCKRQWSVNIWGLCHQKQVSQAEISNCIPQYSVECNYLSMPEITASGAKVLICRHCIPIKWKYYDYAVYDNGCCSWSDYMILSFHEKIPLALNKITFLQDILKRHSIAYLLQGCDIECPLYIYIYIYIFMYIITLLQASKLHIQHSIQWQGYHRCCSIMSS